MIVNYGLQSKGRGIMTCTFLILACIVLCAGAPQSYYYNNNYYPYRRNGYSNRDAAVQSTYHRHQPTIKQATAISRLNVIDSNTAGTSGWNTYATSLKRAVGGSVDRNSDRSKYRVSRADAENAKFAGAGNQETDDESSKTLLHIQRKRLNRRRLYGKRCLPFGRDAAGDQVNAVTTSSTPKEQGRFLWDLNVYNVYQGYGGPGAYADIGNGCGLGIGGSFGSGLGGGLGGGLFSDPIAPAYPAPALNNFLGLFAPGILQNALAATVRPPLRPPIQADDSSDGEVNDLQNDPAVDPNYGARPPVRRPNRVYYDSAGAAPITPAQLLGGVATTVNGIIQQLTGNVQPVYQSYRRSANYG